MFGEKNEQFGRINGNLQGNCYEMKNRDGIFATDQVNELSVWKEHFENLHNSG